MKLALLVIITAAIGGAEAAESIDEIIGEASDLLTEVSLRRLPSESDELGSSSAKGPPKDEDVNEMVVAIVGGSASAGGGHIAKANQYSTLLSHKLGCRVDNHAHGTTDTFYTVLNFHSLVPLDATHIVWEYAINDAAEARNNQARYFDVFRAFIDLVEQHPNKPVLVFVFLWDGPFLLPAVTSVFNKLTEVGLLKNQHVIDVPHQWVEPYCKEHPRCTTDDFVADRHHANAAGHKFIANALYDVLKHNPQFRPLNEDRDRAQTLFEGHPLQMERPMRTTSLLFDFPRVDSEKAIEKSFAGLHLEFEFSGKQDPVRSDRIRYVKIPGCESGVLTIPVTIKANERIVGVNIGDESMRCRHCADTHAVGVDDLLVKWIEETGKNITRRLKKGSWKIPIFRYRGFFDSWFVPRADEIAAGQGHLEVCRSAEKSSNYARWISVVIAPNSATNAVTNAVSDDLDGGRS